MSGDGDRDAAASGTVVRGAALFDGEEWRDESDVLVQAGAVTAIADAGSLDVPHGALAIDAVGAVLAPGFIDLHCMERGAAAASGKDAVNFLTQGVTTVVTGNCGVGTPAGPATDLAINIVEIAGHNAARSDAGQDTTETVRRLRSHLEGGARGVSLGLMYEPGRSASLAELTEVSALVEEHGGVLATHLRDEGRGLISSINEVLAIRNEARTVVMHLKACGEPNWPLLDRGRDLLSREGVVWTYYPYTDTNTRLAAAVPYHFGTPEALRGLLRDSRFLERFRSDGLQTLARNGWDGVLIADGPPSIVGSSVASVARARGIEAEFAVAELLADDPDIRVRFVEVAELDGIRDTARMDLAIAASDAYIFDSSAMAPEHPRSFGAIARSLQWAREGGYVDHFLRGVTSRAADLYCISRGRIMTGAPADLVLLDLQHVQDRATYEEPARLASGVEKVWVAGRLAYDGNAPTRHRWGQVL